MILHDLFLYYLVNKESVLLNHLAASIRFSLIKVKAKHCKEMEAMVYKNRK